MTVSANVFIFSVFSIIMADHSYKKVTCGIDNSTIDVVYEGVAAIETYPWMGYLFYPMNKQLLATVVVLVTKQIVLGTATEIDNLPKDDFRTRARIILGQGCSGERLRVRDYAFHPDYARNTFSALAIIQLNLDGVTTELRPICPPPTHLINPEFYAITLTPDCNKPAVRLYEMKFVDSNECRTYYRKSGLDMDMIWPTHTACARARRGGRCVWGNGAALVLRQGKRWNLAGFGVYGPGCKAPARFLDYGMYHHWVRRSIARIGRPAITRIADNEVILRRSLSNLQRYGACDLGEIKAELYTDHTSIKAGVHGMRRIRYNMTIYASIEYSCVIFKANNVNTNDKKPKLRLRRWCAGPMALCSEYQHLEIDFYVEITFSGAVTYDLKAYGQEFKGFDPRTAMLYYNQHSPPSYVPQASEMAAVVAGVGTKENAITWYRDHKDY